jgi:hypothetical protein
MEFNYVTRRLGIFSAAATAILIFIYGVTLVIGFLSLESPDQPIGNPWFTILEILILIMMPVMVALMVVVHARAPAGFRALSFTAVLFMGMTAVVTCGLHFVILTTSRHAEFASQSWLPLFFGFKWPSVIYALDILAWDFFFPLSMFFAAPVFFGSRLAEWIRWLMIGSGGLALAGLSGVVFGNMQLRNIGIVGYVGVFLVTAVLMAFFFYREPRQDA